MKPYKNSKNIFERRSISNEYSDNIYKKSENLYKNSENMYNNIYKKSENMYNKSENIFIDYSLSI